jgi:hypothetical protein
MRKVTRQAEHGRALSRQHIGGLGDFGSIQTGDDHLHPLACQPGGDPLPDPPARSGHDGDLPD